MRSLFAAVTLASIAATSCNDLPTIDASGCGNRLINADREDCDGQAPAGARCAAPGEANACRYVCDPQQRAGEPACPSGFGCGQDGLCRSWSGQFTPLGNSISTGDARLLASDLDGDRRPELVTMGVPDQLGGRSVRLISLLADGSVRQTTPLSSLLGAPRFGDLTGDGVDDLLLGYNNGVAVLSNQRGQGLSPLVYPTFSLGDPTGQQRVRAYPVRFSVETPRARVVVLVHGRDDAGNPINVLLADDRTRVAPSTCDPNELATQGSTTLASLGDDEGPENVVYVSVGAFDPATTGGERLVLGFSGRQDALVFDPVRPGAADQWNQIDPPEQPYRPPQRVKLANGAHPQDSAHWIKVDADAWFDLVLGTDKGPQIAYGRSDGAFSSTPGGDATNQAQPIDAITLQGGGPCGDQCTRLLAVGRLNDDDRIDYVFDRVIVESVAGGDSAVYAATYTKMSGSWSEAVVTDLDGDGRSDVALVPELVPNVEVLLNRGGGLYNPSLLSSSAPVSKLISADLDGDGIHDLIFREQGYHQEDNPPPTAALGDALLVSFSQRGSAPLAPASVGRFNNLRQLSAMPLVENALLSPDGYADIGVVYEPEGGGSSSVSILFGNASRQLLAPYGLAETNCNIRALSVGHAVGRFSADDHPDLVALGGTIGEPQNPGSQEQNARLWTVQGQGQGQLGSPALSDRLGSEYSFKQAERAPMPGQGGDIMTQVGLHDEALLAVGDVDRAADGLDELVLVAPTGGIAASNAPPPRGAVLVARSVELSDGRRRLQPQGDPLLFDRSIVRSERPALADLDGDGFLDLLLLAAPGFGDASLLIFWNNQAGAFAAPQVVDGLTSPRSFALLPALDGGPPSVVIVGEGQASLLRYDGQRAPALAALPASLGGTSVTAGDFNGDGLHDIAVLQTGQTQLFAGEPRLR